jgi:zinc transport system substrate-binding protein
MKTWIQRLVSMAIVFGLVSAVMVGCQSSDDTQHASHDHGTAHKMVASTSWTALIAKTAGAEDVTVLAPVDMRHPNEYDFKPSDIDTVKSADMIFYSQYEPFMKKIFESAETPKENQIAVMTENTPDNLKKQVSMIADLMDTTDKATAWETDLDALYGEIQKGSAQLKPEAKKVVAHVFMVPVAKSMGFEIIGEFGPAELSATKVAELAALKPALVVDNYHMPQGAEIAKVANAPFVELRNFPETAEQTMLELITSNAVKLGVLSK